MFRMFRMPFRKSHRSQGTKGFSLIELLAVLAIIGIISGIAIPKFLGQRKRSRIIGDAISNAKVLQMALESRRAEVGTYGTAGATYGWKADGSDPSGPALAPMFQPRGNSQMNYTITIDGTGLGYVLTVADPFYAGATAYQTNQTGQELARMTY
jgi:prepilin-type N-terminal cleavage/methylation domain-containing protein